MRGLLRKERGEGGVDAFVVRVEPCEGLRAEEIGQDGRCVDMAESHGLEIKPVAKL